MKGTRHKVQGVRRMASSKARQEVRRDERDEDIQQAADRG
jgi:hypothetical protein